MSKHKKEPEFDDLNKFQKTVMDVSKRLQQFPSGMLPRQEFINFKPAQLHELQTTADLWREHYRSANLAEIIAICCRFFREHVADEENEEV